MLISLRRSARLAVKNLHFLAVDNLHATAAILPRLAESAAPHASVKNFFPYRHAVAGDALDCEQRVHRLPLATQTAQQLQIRFLGVHNRNTSLERYPRTLRTTGIYSQDHLSEYR